MTSLGVPAATIRGTCYGTTAAPITNCSADGSIDTAAFTKNITGLTANTLYYFRGYATNADGTVYSADLTFTTATDGGGGADITAPTIISLSPLDNAIDVLVDTNLIMTFSEIVSAGTGNITIKKAFDNSTVETIDVTSGQVTGGGTATITVNPSVTLDSSTDYYIQVAA